MERLLRMKAGHEEGTPHVPREQVDSVLTEIKTLIDQSVTASEPVWGHHRSHCEHSFWPSAARSEVSARNSAKFPAAEPKQGQARFRLPDQRLGVHWSSLPFSDGPDFDIYLVDGPAMWLRLLPKAATENQISAADLRDCALQEGPGNSAAVPVDQSPLFASRRRVRLRTRLLRLTITRQTSIALRLKPAKSGALTRSCLTIQAAKDLVLLETIARAFTRRLRRLCHSL